jgi:hypothetical protein
LDTPIELPDVFARSIDWLGDGAPDPAETARLLSAATTRPGERPQEPIARLEACVNEFPQSGRTPSVREALAEHSSQRLHYERAMDHWAANLQVLRDEVRLDLKAAADRALAFLTRHFDGAAGTVSFRSKDYADAARLKTLTLRGQDLVGRWLLHVLPAGFTKVRHYGLLGNNRRKKLIPLARQALAHSPHRRELAPTKRPPTAPSPPPPPTCPHCGSVRVRCVYRLDATGRVVWRRWPLPVVRAPPRPLDSS